jgi:single-stranded DNA-binding protein
MISVGVLRFVDDPFLTKVGNTYKSSFKLVYNTKRYSNNELIKEPNYLDFECWDSGAKFIVENCVAGDQIYVESTPKQETWEKDGQKRSKIVFRIDKFKIFN